VLTVSKNVPEAQFKHEVLLTHDKHEVEQGWHVLMPLISNEYVPYGQFARQVLFKIYPVQVCW
jgi:hypothetical protein